MSFDFYSQRRKRTPGRMQRFNDWRQFIFPFGHIGFQRSPQLIAPDNLSVDNGLVCRLCSHGCTTVLPHGL